MRRFGRGLFLLFLIAALPAQMVATQRSDCAAGEDMGDMIMSSSAHDHAVDESSDCCASDGIIAVIEDSPERSPVPDCMTSLPCASPPALPVSVRVTLPDVSSSAWNVLLVHAPLEAPVDPESPPPRI